MELGYRKSDIAVLGVGGYTGPFEHTSIRGTQRCFGCGSVFGTAGFEAS
jgi:hypothetical protein